MDPATMAAFAKLFGQAKGQTLLGEAAPPAQLGGSPVSSTPFSLPSPDLNSLIRGSAPATEAPESFRQGSTPTEEVAPEIGPFGQFLGGLDKGLQSPAQLAGLGLLSRLGGNNSALPLAGLLGMGLYKGNRQ